MGKKFSALSAAAALTASDILAAIQGGASVKATMAQLLTYIQANLTAIGIIKYSEAKLISDVTTTSTSFVDLTGSTVTLTTGAHRCLVTFKGMFTSSTTAYGYYDVVIDGVAQGGTDGSCRVGASGTTGLLWNVSFSLMTGVLSAGSHTIKIQWKTNSGTGTTFCTSVPCILSVTETGLTA